ncbi:histidine kinase [Flavobacterium sp.]|uniref:helix-turn-helix and ligand-binding sensor domain-containing protein n=1 Tax=Flavobacterium sp. TaxID=239 RepID=UPI00286E1933|nr:histidine kinase [Flavobacterium sp.]
MKSKVLKFLFFFFLSFTGYSQDLLPFVDNYNKYNYQGDNQIWDVVQGKDKAMYFANNHYFLRYDGVKWEKYTLPNKTIIRSVYVDGNKIYSGSYKEFGYWFREKGKMIYVSISKDKKLFTDNGNEEIWKIFTVNSKVYFQSFNQIYILHKEEITKIILPFQISYCFQVNGELILASTTDGVYKMKGIFFEKIKNWNILDNTIVHSIETKNNKTYIFTQKKGVFIADNEGIKEWNHPLNSTLKTAIINVAKFANPNQLIIGTASKGVYTVNINDNSFLNISRENILINNSILSIGFDSEKNLWLGLDNGIAHIEINSPVSIFYDNSGVLGSVYSVASTKKGYLMASNHGIFKYENKKLSLLPNSQGQAWNISKIQNQYLIGHSEGTFLYENNILKKINSISGGWNFTKSNLNSNFLQATYSGVVVYHTEKDFSQHTQLKDFYKPIRYVAQNKINEVWAADNYRGLYKVLYDENYIKIKLENIAQKNNITNDFGVKIFEFRNEIIFLLDNIWYTYNSITNLLEKNELFNDHFKNISDIIAIDDSNFLVLKSNLLYMIRTSGNKFIWNFIQEKYYRGKIINDNLRLFRNENKYLLNLDDGFISLQLRKNNNNSIPVIKVEAHNENRFITNRSKIKHNTELKLYIISGLYGDAKPNLFYTIDGDKNFISTFEGTLTFNNLSSGLHKVSVYFNDGSKLYMVSTFEFTVAKPWYFSFWMIIVYFLTINTILYLYYKWNKIRYNQKLALQEEELRHQKNILEMQLKAENKLNIQEYQKHILELEIQTKASEVVGKSLSIAKQNEMIENIQQILETEKDIDKLKSEIKKGIKINAVNKNEWKIFENNLNQIHNKFIIDLSKKHPNLTSKDINLCIYLKMNLSSKEIAPLMNISFRGVELHRYRLRKKLGLRQEDSLSNFMISI